MVFIHLISLIVSAQVGMWREKRRRREGESVLHFSRRLLQRRHLPMVWRASVLTRYVVLVPIFYPFCGTSSDIYITSTSITTLSPEIWQSGFCRFICLIYCCLFLPPLISYLLEAFHYLPQSYTSMPPS
jgi:hypothetical protein